MNLRENYTVAEDFAECLSQQLTELELLKSMYPNQGEIVLSDKHIIDEINNFIARKAESLPSHLDFKLNLLASGIKLEVFINLPTGYPIAEPDIYVRCNQLNRQNDSRLNSELSNYLKENHDGEVCLYTAISWLQENIEHFKVIALEPDEHKDIPSEEEEYARLWIYSHHIYNKKKREDIVKKARELKLTGFSLPGKPGIVCIEGNHRDCKEWWKDIKSMSWKKIVIRETELFPSAEKKTYKKFSCFEEIKLNMSDLAKYLNDLGLNHVFNDLFGLCSED